MRPIVVTVGPLATASANNIALSQTPNAGALTLNGSTVVSGVAVLDKPRKVLITTAANESAKAFTITGTNWSGSTVSETLTGPNVGTAQSVLDYATVTSITISANAAGAVTVGTNTVAGSPWVRLDDWADAQAFIQCSVSGTVNYTVQQTSDDPNSPTNPVAPALVNWLANSNLALVNATATVQGNYLAAPTFVQVILNSGTGSVSMTLTQFGAVPY